MARMLRFMCGFALLPLCVAVTLALFDMLRISTNTSTLISPQCLWLLIGFFFWLGLWFFLPQPIRAYVIAHELTHALWGILFGARVRNLHVSVNGGSVRLSKNNILITLAPYFFPFYTVLVIVICCVTRLICGYIPMPLLWLFLVGLTWGFHMCFTIQSLLIKQPDIQDYGALFSYTLIYLFNLAGAGLWIVMTTEASVHAFAKSLIAQTWSAYASAFHLITTSTQFLLNLVLTLKR